MNISRRDLFKFAGLSVAAAAVTGCSTTAFNPLPSAGANNGTAAKMLGKHQVVIIGGGWGGLTVAKELKKIDPKFDVAIIEKNDSFMSCPFSNCNLGGLKGVSLSTLTHDYSQAVEKNGYGMLTAVVTGIDRVNKVVHTSKGGVGYDILVLAPGIDYNYKGQFPAWSDAKIAKARRAAPAALVPGGEHVALDRMVKTMEEGDVVITVPAGKYRCPPAPFERASMIANYMKKEGLSGKVIILNETAEIAKGLRLKRHGVKSIKVLSYTKVTAKFRMLILIKKRLRTFKRYLKIKTILKVLKRLKHSNTVFSTLFLIICQIRSLRWQVLPLLRTVSKKLKWLQALKNRSLSKPLPIKLFMPSVTLSVMRSLQAVNRLFGQVKSVQKRSLMFSMVNRTV
jgi:hypothetical protein